MPASRGSGPAEDVPVQVEDGLAGAGADEHHQPVLVQPGSLRGLRDEIDHPLRLLLSHH
jgi:hypothetical protein